MRRAVSGTQHGYGGTNVPEEEGEKERKEERKRGRRRVTSVLVCSTAAPHTHKTPHMCTTPRFARPLESTHYQYSFNVSFFPYTSFARTYTHTPHHTARRKGRFPLCSSLHFVRTSLRSVLIGCLDGVNVLKRTLGACQVRPY